MRPNPGVSSCAPRSGIYRCARCGARRFLRLGPPGHQIFGRHTQARLHMTKFKFLRKRSEYYRHFTVLDIGTDLIKVLVVRREGPDGEVLGVGREPQAPAAMSGAAIPDLDSVTQSSNPPPHAPDYMPQPLP